MANQGTPALRPERIAEVSNAIGKALAEDLASLRSINTQTRMLSLNARIEAARAGASGAAFAVVAQGVMDLSHGMDTSFGSLETRTGPLLKELAVLSERLATDVRGMRLADIAANNLDLIDRNLYERSCDVRWWATEGALVSALETPDQQAFHRASVRMGKILDSYTVYFDLVLCDLNGRILANGRPDQFRSVGSDVSDQEWFRVAKATRSGAEFGFQGVHASPLAGGERVLVYSATVRRNGEENGESLGVLGVVFRWDALGQTIVRTAPLPEHELARTQIVIVDSAERILASAGGASHESAANWPKWLSRDPSPRFHFRTDLHGREVVVAIARSQGYETYATGWIGAIIQEVEE